jgi:hypothetical protein
MIQLHLTNRQYGLPHAQKRLQEACDGRTADLAKDIFSPATFELPINHEHKVLRSGDWAAVLSENPLICRLALWSLLTRRKVWDIATQQAQSKLYIESFIQDFNTQEESPIRLNFS